MTVPSIEVEKAERQITELTKFQYNWIGEREYED